MKIQTLGILLAILAATFYAISFPFSKILLEFIPSTLMAGFLYLGAGICMVIVGFLKKVYNFSKKIETKTKQFSKMDLLFVLVIK